MQDMTQQNLRQLMHQNWCHIHTLALKKRHIAGFYRGFGEQFVSEIATKQRSYQPRLCLVLPQVQLLQPNAVVRCLKDSCSASSLAQDSAIGAISGRRQQMTQKRIGHQQMTIRIYF